MSNVYVLICMCACVCIHIWHAYESYVCLFSDLSLNSKKNLKIEDYELTSVNN